MRTKEEILAEIEGDKSRIREIDGAYQGQFLDPASDDGQEWDERNARVEENKRTVAQLEKRESRLAELADEPKAHEDGVSFHTAPASAVRGEDIYDLTTVRSSAASPERMHDELKERAFRAIEMSRPKGDLCDPDKARENITFLVEERDQEDGRLARYLLAVGSPLYRRAFGKYLQRGDTSGMTRGEQTAWFGAQQAERAMSLTGASGGFAVPFELDPTILNTSNGVVNPIRSISRVEQITTDEWRGVSSAGITASYAAEATETTDNAPTLAQPTVSTEKAQAFVPFSIEVGQDWSGLQSQMATLLADAKDTLEAGKFVSGTGTNEPFGVLTGTTTTVAAATGLTMTLANLYSLKNALPPRYRVNGTYLADSAILDRVRQFDTVGSSAAIWIDSLEDGMASRLLGRPVYEASEMAETITNATKIALYGDFSRYLIVDRVGLTIEVIPHLFGSNQRPTGQRGIYAYWRNGAKVIDANAFRALTGTT